MCKFNRTLVKALPLSAWLVLMASAPIAAQRVELYYDAARDSLYVDAELATPFVQKRDYFSSGDPIVIRVVRGRLNSAFSTTFDAVVIAADLPEVRGLDGVVLLSGAEGGTDPEAMGFRTITGLEVPELRLDGVLDSLADPRTARTIEGALRAQRSELQDGFRSLRLDAAQLRLDLNGVVGASAPSRDPTNEPTACASLHTRNTIVGTLRALDCLKATVSAAAPLGVRDPNTVATLSNQDFLDLTGRFDQLLTSLPAMGDELARLRIRGRIDALVADVEQWRRKRRTFDANVTVALTATNLFREVSDFERREAVLRLTERLNGASAHMGPDSLSTAIESYRRGLTTGATDAVESLRSTACELASSANDSACPDSNAGADGGSVAEHFAELVMMADSLTAHRLHLDSLVAATNESVAGLMTHLNRVYAEYRRSGTVELRPTVLEGNFLVRFAVAEHPGFKPYTLSPTPTGLIPLGPAERSGPSNGSETPAPPTPESEIPAKNNLFDGLLEVHQSHRLNIVGGGGVALGSARPSVIDSTASPSDTVTVDRRFLFLAVKMYLVERDVFPRTRQEWWKRALPAPFIGGSISDRPGLVLGLAFEPVTGIDLGFGRHWYRHQVTRRAMANDEVVEHRNHRGDVQDWFVTAAIDLNLFRLLFGSFTPGTVLDERGGGSP